MEPINLTDFLDDVTGGEKIEAFETKSGEFVFWNGEVLNVIFPEEIGHGEFGQTYYHPIYSIDEIPENATILRKIFTDGPREFSVFSKSKTIESCESGESFWEANQ